MKRKSLIFVTLIMTVIMVTVFVGCKSFKQKDLFALADYSVDSAEESREISVKVETTDNGGAAVVVYEIVNGEVISAPIEGFDFAGLVFEGKGTALKFDETYFSNISFAIGKDDNIATFIATISNPSEFMGVADATDAKIDAKCNVKTKQLISNKVTYSKTINVKTYNVTVETVMKY